MEQRRPLTAKDARAAARRAVRELARDARVKVVYLFGSAADPRREFVRDLDLALLTDPALSLHQLMRLRADVVAITRVPVDLVSLNEASVVLSHEVVASGQCLYARTPEIEVDFVTRTHARYWDFKPYLDEQWRLTGERLEERRRGSET
jgi:predicted nucleotidyltransferase